jgi:hypothetical protein
VGRLNVRDGSEREGPGVKASNRRAGLRPGRSSAYSPDVPRGGQHGVAVVVGAVPNGADRGPGAGEERA